jgi:hypothetical protein
VNQQLTSAPDFYGFGGGIVTFYRLQCVYIHYINLAQW